MWEVGGRAGGGVQNKWVTCKNFLKNFFFKNFSFLFKIFQLLFISSTGVHQKFFTTTEKNLVKF